MIYIMYLQIQRWVKNITKEYGNITSMFYLGASFEGRQLHGIKVIVSIIIIQHKIPTNTFMLFDNK